MGRVSNTGTPTPRGNTLEGQLRLSFRQVLRNGAMGIDQCAFMGSHFGIDSATVRRSFQTIQPSGGTVDEAKFLEVIEHALTQSNFRPAEVPQRVSRNSAILHKELSMNPFLKIPIFLPTNRPLQPLDTSLSNMPFDPLSPANSKRAKFPSRLATPSLRLNHSGDRGVGASSPLASARGQPRSHSVPPMTPRGLDGAADELQRPGSAFYMKPYTPRSSLGDLLTWKWNSLDNNVPKNIRNVLLKPMKMQRPITPALKSPELTAIMDRMKVAMRGTTRMEAISALSLSNSLEGKGQTGLTSVRDAKNALQMLGFNMTDDEVRLLADQCKALSADGQFIKPFLLTQAMIPLAGKLDVKDVGIIPEKFIKFKQQRLTFTRALSKKEVELMHHLRNKLAGTCLGGPSELRKAFKLVDEKLTGRCDMKGMTLALELQGLGMSRLDAEILYTILDPDGKGMDYNEFTAMMMPPDLAEATSQTVALGYERGASKSRQGLRNRQMGAHAKAHVKTKPDPDEVQRFMSRLTSDHVVQVLKNRVALALKAGPGAIRKWFALFDKDGDNQIDEAELKDLMVDFGLNLSEAQVTALMNKIDMNQNGLLDQSELIAALLPADQFSLTASAAELKDPFEVGCTHGTGKIQGNDLRDFLRDKLIRTFVKKGVSAKRERATDR